MNRAKWIVLGSVFSSILVLLGAISKIQHWESTKPLMLVGMAMQIGIFIYAIIPLVRKK